MLKYSKQKLVIVGFIVYFFSLVGMLIAPVLTYLGALQLSRRMFILSMLVTIIAIIILFLSREFVSEKTKFQIMLVYFILLLVFLPLFLRSIINGYTQYSYFGWIELLVLSTGFIFWFTNLSHKSSHLFKAKNWVFNHKVLVFVVIFVFIISLEQLTKWLRWDTIHYYAYIERIKAFSFSPNDILMFKASGHACYAYILIYSIGESLLPGTGYGVRLETIIIFIISIFLLYKIMEVILPKGKKNWRDFSIAVYAVTPVILGPIHNIDVEILFMTLFFALFYCYIKKYYILTLFFGLLFVFTKETGILLMLGFGLYELLILLGNFKKHRNIILELLRCWKRYLSLYFPALVFVLYFSIDTTWGSTKAKENVDNFNAWGLDWMVVINKIKQLFIMNFIWIPILIILIAIVYYIVKRQWKKRQNPYYILAICCYSLFLTTQMFYITYTFPRYIYIQYFYVAIALQEALNLLTCNDLIKKVVCTLCLGLTFIQNFYSLDIVSRFAFDTMPIGNTEILVNAPFAYVDNSTLLRGDDASFLVLSPYADMNRQWSYFDELINRFLETVEYKSTDLVLYPDTFYPRSSNVFFGMWSDSYFDSKNKRLKQKISSGYQVDDMFYYNAYIMNEEVDNINEYKNIYFLEFPFKEKFQNNLPFSNQVVDTIDIKYRGWTLRAHKIKVE